MEIAGDLVLDKYLLDRCNRTMWATIFDMMRLGWSFFDMFGFVNVAVVVFLWVLCGWFQMFAGAQAWSFFPRSSLLYGGWYVH